MDPDPLSLCGLGYRRAKFFGSVSETLYTNNEKMRFQGMGEALDDQVLSIQMSSALTLDPCQV